MLEIEHKYLVADFSFRDFASNSVRIRQGYLTRSPECVVRIRIKGSDKAFITVKGKTHSEGSLHTDVRAEYEYPIPVADAEEMLALCGGKIIDKTRWLVPFGGYLWEVDEFHGAHEGLVIAEIEVGSPDEKYPLPPFVGEEVTGDPRYYNSNLT